MAKDKPTDAERNAANERDKPPMHEQHPLSREEQRIVDEAAARTLRERS